MQLSPLRWAWPLCLPGMLAAQTGPGGIGSSTNNVLWLSADKGVTQLLSLVSAWADRSGNGNNAAIPLLALTATPNYLANACNGNPALVFDGLDDELRVVDDNSLDLAAWHMFIVMRPNVQKDYNAWFTKGDDGQENYEMLSYQDGNIHTPIYFTDNSRGSPSSPGAQVNTSTFEVIEYSYSAAAGRAVYKNGASIYSDSPGKIPKTNNKAVYIGNEANSTGRFVNGAIAEVILYKAVLNAAQRIIVNNYLSSKYERPLGSGDLYVQDEAANGDFDRDVSGIGRVNSSNTQTDSRGSGIVEVVSTSATDLNDNEFLFWGHNGGVLGTWGVGDLPTGVQGRWQRAWRVNEVTNTGTATDIGTVDMTFDLAGLGSVNAAHLRLLVDANGDGLFANDTTIKNASHVGGSLYRFTGVNSLANGRRFTLGTSNITSTPLPIELLTFDVTADGTQAARVIWATASEQDNAYFTVERSADTQDWQAIGTIPGAGTSINRVEYAWVDAPPLPGTSYYRLVQTDVDGTSTRSAVVTFQQGSSLAMTIAPNPARERLQARFGPNVTAIQVTDLSGRLLDVPVVRANGAAELDISGLHPGAYLLTAVGAAERQARIFVVE